MTFREAVAKLDSPILVTSLRVLGTKAISPPEWDREGIYRLALIADKPVIQKHVGNNEWTRAPLEPPATQGQVRLEQEQDSASQSRQVETTMKVFISHSSADRDAAGAFVEFLRAALPIPAKELRCTSVDGYKLPAGTNAEEQLRQEVFEAETFVAILSPNSLASMYVMFELGARWGAKGHLIPLMIGGVGPSHLKAPLSAIHAVSGTSEGDMHQLVDTIAARLKLQAEKPNVYMKAMQAFMLTATAGKTSP